MQSIDISKIDSENVAFNGSTCAAVYKADAGKDLNGEFVILSEIDGAYRSKIRLENLTVNTKPHRNADSAASELNQFIGRAKKCKCSSSSTPSPEENKEIWKPDLLWVHTCFNHHF